MTKNWKHYYLSVKCSCCGSAPGVLCYGNGLIRNGDPHDRSTQGLYAWIEAVEQKLTEQAAIIEAVKAGYVKPRVVTTVAELEALPRLSVVQTPGRIWQKLGGSPAYYEWQAADGGFARNSENFLDCNQHLTILMQTKGTL